jgi:hypothetical protein
VIELFFGLTIAEYFFTCSLIVMSREYSGGDSVKLLRVESKEFFHAEEG